MSNRPSRQSVTLSGDALSGVGPHIPQLMALPQAVRLGRIRPAALPPAPRFRAYFDPDKMATRPPTSTNRRANAAASIACMYLNDRLGICVIAGKMHSLGLWSGNDSDSGGVVLATDQECEQQYHAICGPGDNGCVITNVLDVMRTRGLVAGGKAYKIDGYVSIDHTDRLETQVSVVLFGTVTIGINLPSAWTQNAVWDVTTSRIVGGHDVSVVDYDEKGVYVASWGRIYLITWAAFTNKRWVEEAYVLLAPLWYGMDNMAPSGVDVATLKLDLAKLSHGEIPPLPDPDPPVPPTPSPVGTEIVSLVGLDTQGHEVARFRKQVGHEQL